MNHTTFNSDFSYDLRKNSIELSLIANDSQLSDTTLVNSNLANCFNNELLTLGYDKSTDFNKLFRNGLDLIERYSRQLKALQRVKEECYKLDKENELMLKRQQALKDVNETSHRDLSTLEEKYRQLQFKVNSLTKTIKEHTDENRKLQNIIEQRDKQYKHDRKKLEKENDKLKERIQVLTTGKNKELPNLDISETILRNSNAPRATWNLDGSKKQLELYSELIKDYDRKTKELIIENTDLRSFINNVYSDLSKSANNKSKIDDSCYENENTFQVDNDDLDLSEQIIKLPFENIQDKLQKEFKSKLDLVKECSNLSISTINSMASSCNSDMLNTTITIDNKSDYLCDSESKHEFMNNFKAKSMPLSTSSSSSSSPSTSPLTDHFVQKSDDLIDNEIKIINEERIKLSKEKKLFYEQKLKIEKEAIICRKITTELNNAKKAFEEEQENFYQSKLFSSFVSQPNRKA